MTLSLRATWLGDMREKNKVRVFFYKYKKPQTKYVASIHTRAFCAFSFCAFSTRTINILHFVECSWSVLPKTSGHLLFSKLKFTRMSLISVLAMLEGLQFYFILLPKCWQHLSISLGNSKSPCATNKGKLTADIYFCHFYIKLQNKCKTLRKTWLDDDADYNTRTKNFLRDIHTCGNCQSSQVAFWKSKKRYLFQSTQYTKNLL